MSALARATRPVLSIKPRKPPAGQAQQAREPDAPHGRCFWVVWAREGVRPKRRHPSLESARAEVRRLAALHPERTFHLYRCEPEPASVEEHPK